MGDKYSILLFFVFQYIENRLVECDNSHRLVLLLLQQEGSRIVGDPRQRSESDDGRWSERTVREDGSVSHLWGDTNSDDGSHGHVVYDSEGDIDYFRSPDASHSEPEFDTRRGDTYPSDDSSND